MDELIKSIAKNKNFYGPDIDMENFMESISTTECRNYENVIKDHNKKFFSEDSGEVLGYYVCKGEDVFNFYLIKVNKKLYMALENTPPYYWYQINNYEDFRAVRKIYNKKTDQYENRTLLIATQLWNGPKSESYIMENIRSDYEYTMILHDMCRNNPYLCEDIFSTNEFHYTNLNRDELSSLECALLNKHIINYRQGFHFRTALTNSVVSVKCKHGLVFFACYFDNCINGVKNGNIPIDLAMFLTNFKLTTIRDIVRGKSSVDLMRVNQTVPIDFYADVRNEIYLALVDNDKKEETFNEEYMHLLQNIFTEHTVNRIIFGLGDKAEALKSMSDKSVRDVLRDEFTEDEKKFVNMKFFAEMKFTPNKNKKHDEIKEVKNKTKSKKSKKSKKDKNTK